MKKIFLMILLLSVTASAQTVRWQTFQQSIAVNDADTTWFAFNAGFFSRNVSPDSNAINPPDIVDGDETPIVTVRKTAGNSADSLIVYAKPIDHAGRIVNNDSSFVLGSSFAAPSTPNTFGNGSLYGKTLAFNTKRYNGFIIIAKLFDFVGGSRRFEFGMGTR